MTLIKRIWLLRGDVQIAINEKKEQFFAQVLTALDSPGFEFEVMNSKMATNYIDYAKNDFENVLDRPNYIPKLIQNVKNLRDYRFGDKRIDVGFGEEECPMHTLWVLRAKFEKLKYNCHKNKDEIKENHELFEEIFTVTDNLLTLAKQHLSFDEELALMNIRDEIRGFYEVYTAEWARNFPKR